ncbi:hypothetical protein HOA92_05225 [archaeon]|nr:hypothetical protein [archaeon]MBT6762416.1 hypothetical protein [archaeon]
MGDTEWQNFYKLIPIWEMKDLSYVRRVRLLNVMVMINIFMSFFASLIFLVGSMLFETTIFSDTKMLVMIYFIFFEQTSK